MTLITRSSSAALPIIPLTRAVAAEIFRNHLSTLLLKVCRRHCVDPMAAARDTPVSIAQGNAVAALAPISKLVGRRCRRASLASLTRAIETCLIEWLKLDDRFSVIAAYPERHQASIAAAGWSEGEAPGGCGSGRAVKDPTRATVGQSRC